MGEFILRLLVFLLAFGFMTISGYKAKEAWDKWHCVTPAIQSIATQQNIAGDLVNGDKIVIGNHINITGANPLLEKSSMVDVAKLKIKRAFEDFDKNIAAIAESFPEEAETIAEQFNARGMLRSGLHIKAQMDLSVNTKKKLDGEINGLERKIEDILIETFNKTSLDSVGVEFEAERNQLEEAKKQCIAIYLRLNESPKSWEVNAFGDMRLTKDFTVADK